MTYSRTGIVAVLLAAEAFIAGGILTQASGLHMHTQHYRASTNRSFDAGAAPHVVVDDANSRIVVSPSNDGKVHVVDDSQVQGVVWGNPGTRSALAVNRTDDGVSVTRPGGGSVSIAVFGYSDDRVEIEVPPAAFIDMRGCDGATISGLRAQKIAVACQDGSLRVSDVALQSGTLHTDDGSIHLSLLTTDTTVHALTNDGSLRINGRRVHSDDDAVEDTFTMGSGSGRLEVGTHDGGIRISTQGVN